MENRNLLRHERSPYLLQHAEQPIWWKPWGDAAFEQARLEGKLVFLSIGYATCHWCHVMAEEAFVDAELAALLNERFVAIKLDRQERPDIDAIYMLVCEAMTGSGGWPLNVVLTPERTPLFAGTYFPPHTGMRGQGLCDILRTIHRLWTHNREGCQAQGASIMEAISRAVHGAAKEPSAAQVDLVRGWLGAVYDSSFGGFGRMPKFPNANALLFLLWEARLGREDALGMVVHSLERMARGGIHDWIGGGFMRYATDRKWRLPHYEKMLYDNALLALVYAQAHCLTGSNRFLDVVHHIYAWVFRDLMLPEGGFASAQDADDPQGEGVFYLWSPEEIRAAVGEAQAPGLTALLNIKEPASLPYLAQRARIPENLPELLEQMRRYRATRPTPAIDDQALTAWNALMVLSLAKVGQMLGEPAYIDRAKRTADFIQTHLSREDGTLQASYRKGQTYGEGTLSDYAYWALALCALYDATWDGAYLDLAHMTAQHMVRLFGDEGQLGFAMSASDASDVILRLRPSADEALPSPNGAAALALQYLVNQGAQGLRLWADGLMNFLGGAIQHQPEGHALAALALSSALHPMLHLVCVPGGDFDPNALRNTLKDIHSISVLIKNDQAPAFAREDLRRYQTQGNATSYFLCVGDRCLEAVQSLDALKSQLENLR